jgi:hypothetical protein
MFRLSRLSRRATLACVFGVATISAAGAATFHRLATTQTSGSEGALAILQSGASSSALQGEVGSSPNTNLKLPFGVLGEYDASGSTFGTGLLGISTTGYAIAGESLSSSQPSILAEAGGNGMGLEAITQSTIPTVPAIYGTTTGKGDGVDGSATSGNGVFGNATAGGYGVYGQSDVNFGIAGVTGNGPAAYVSNDSAEAYTMRITNQSTAGYLLEADNGKCDPCLSLDPTGNLRITGAIIANMGAVSRTQNPNSDLMAYGEQSTLPTIEDVGSAQLVNGSATVAIAADFRQTVEGSRYMVFLTPYGDNAGLYIASRTPSEFVVRESRGGRSTLAFDYRIVAQRYGAHQGRLPHAASLGYPRALSSKEQLSAQGLRARRQFAPPPVPSMPKLSSLATN